MGRLGSKRGRKKKDVDAAVFPFTTPITIDQPPFTTPVTANLFPLNAPISSNLPPLTTQLSTNPSLLTTPLTISPPSLASTPSSSVGTVVGAEGVKRKRGRPKMLKNIKNSDIVDEHNTATNQFNHLNSNPDATQCISTEKSNITSKIINRKTDGIIDERMNGRMTKRMNKMMDGRMVDRLFKLPICLQEQLTKVLFLVLYP